MKRHLILHVPGRDCILLFSIIFKFTNAYYCYCIYVYVLYLFITCIPKLKWKWTTRFVVVGYGALKKSSGNDSGRNCIYPVGQATNMSSLNCCYRPYNNTWTAYSCCIFSLGENRTEFLFYQVKVKVLNAYNSSSANFLFVQHIHPTKSSKEHSREQLFREQIIIRKEFLFITHAIWNNDKRETLSMYRTDMYRVIYNVCVYIYGYNWMPLSARRPLGAPWILWDRKFLLSLFSYYIILLSIFLYSILKKKIYIYCIYTSRYSILWMEWFPIGCK